MKKVGKDISASDRWKERASSYAETIGGGYHQHRLEVIGALLPSLKGKTVVDFGCGEGVLTEIAVKAGASVVGVDIERTLLDRARKRVHATYLEGGVERLSEIDAADCVIAANVLAYFTQQEEQTFYTEAARILRNAGHLVVTHSNALFDLYTFNAFTAAFFRDHFGVDPSSLLVHPDKPARTTFNIRENPLAYPDKLKGYGFSVERMEFMNRHLAPPLLTNADPDDMLRPRPKTLDEPERWKLMFQCSMFGVRACRTSGR